MLKIAPAYSQIVPLSFVCVDVFLLVLMFFFFLKKNLSDNLLFCDRLWSVSHLKRVFIEKPVAVLTEKFQTMSVSVTHQKIEQA